MRNKKIMSMTTNYTDYTFTTLPDLIKQFRLVFDEVLPELSVKTFKYQQKTYMTKFMAVDPKSTLKEEIERFKNFLMIKYQIY